MTISVSGHDSRTADKEHKKRNLPVEIEFAVFAFFLAQSSYTEKDYGNFVGS